MHTPHMYRSSGGSAAPLLLDVSTKNVVVFCRLLVYNGSYNTNDWWVYVGTNIKR